MRKISILFYDTHAVHILKDPSFPSGGAVRQVLAWSKGLSAIGVRAIIMGGHDEPDYFKENKNVIITYKLSKGIRILRYIYIRIPRIIASIYNSKVDYIYQGVPGPTAGLLALLARFLRKKFILRIASNNLTTIYSKKHRDPVRALFYRFGFSFSHYIVCQNDYQFERLHKIYPNKTYKLRNPYIGNISDHCLASDKRKHIAWIGRFSKAKNVPLLLNIAKALREVPFIIAGNPEINSTNPNHAVLSELRTLPNVTFTGYLKSEEVLQLLRESYILLNTSHYEGFSNTFLEAFSVGTPVFAREKADPDNIIQSHKLGYIYNDVEDLTSALNNILRDCKEYNTIAANCIRYMKENHNLTKQSYDFLRILESGN
jgi:glycosyltransferase involved in cell wall biosynthesis